MDSKQARPKHKSLGIIKPTAYGVFDPSEVQSPALKSQIEVFDDESNQAETYSKAVRKSNFAEAGDNYEHISDLTAYQALFPMHKQSKFGGMQKTNSMKIRMLQMIKKETSDYTTMSNEEITLDDGRKALISFM
jgi:hypothetical protein